MQASHRKVIIGWVLREWHRCWLVQRTWQQQCRPQQIALNTIQFTATKEGRSAACKRLFVELCVCAFVSVWPGCSHSKNTPPCIYLHVVNTRLPWGLQWAIELHLLPVLLSVFCSSTIQVHLCMRELFPVHLRQEAAAKSPQRRTNWLIVIDGAKQIIVCRTSNSCQGWGSAQIVV